MFAQMFPGMGWIPVMILSVSVGLMAGALGTLAAAVNSNSAIARWAAGVACVLGLGMPLLLLINVGGSLMPVGYLCVAVPAVPGLIALGMIWWPSIPPSPAASVDAGQTAPSQALEPSDYKTRGVRLMIAGVVCIPAAFMVFMCCIRPIGYADHRERIQVGMTTSEVREALGGPHERSADSEGKETWIYYCDWTGLSYFGVRFDRESRVEFRWLE
jgi:hypothetical protein